MIPESLTLGEVLAPIISAFAVIVLYHYIGREYLGAAENKYWNSLRRSLLSTSDSYVRKKTSFGLTNPATDADYVGSVSKSSQKFAHVLEDAGYAQCVLSGLKYRPPDADPNEDDVSFESGSMAFRESKSDLLPDVLALRQVHIYWFETPDGVDVYAHEEYSSLNPLVAWKHYRAVSQNAAKGEEVARNILNNAGIEVTE